MSRKLIYTICGISCLTISFVGQSVYNRSHVQETPQNSPKVVIKAEDVTFISVENNALKSAKRIVESSIPSMCALTKTTPQKMSIQEVGIKSNKNRAPEAASPKKESTKKVIIKKKNIALTKVSFDELPGWDQADVKKSLLAFQSSCQTVLKQAPSHPIGTQHIKLKARDWHPVCKAALELDTFSEESAKVFFEKWFRPIELKQKRNSHSLFTGYYMPQIKGNLKQSPKYNTPIYGLPKDGSSTSYTRAQIDNGALKKKAPVIAWIHSPAERLFLEIEGAGVIQLPNGENIYLGYAGENGAPYTSIAKVMINKGLMTRDNASKGAIIRYLEQHPEQAKTILNQNKSFVFFEDVKKPMALGAQGMALTPGYSLAVDRKWIPLGAPLWLDTTRPDKNQEDEKQLQRLMIAQDTGGAIRGFMRGDIYWGSGKLATFLGEHMKNEGQYWLLLPKNILSRLTKKSM